MRRSCDSCARQRASSAATSGPALRRSRSGGGLLSAFVGTLCVPCLRAVGLDTVSIIPPAALWFVKSCSMIPKSMPLRVRGWEPVFGQDHARSRKNRLVPMASRVVDILLPVALDQAYSYRVPDAMELAPGDLVSVPLGARAATGVVWAENPTPNPRLDNRLKYIDERLDIPPLKPELRQFVDWVAGYALGARGMVLRMCLRMGEHLGPARERLGVRLNGPPPQRMTAARQRVLDLLADGLARAKGEAAEEAGVSA